jgi:dTDP-4-amino-4,6-dideoxygalactose transaminase
MFDNSPTIRPVPQMRPGAFFEAQRDEIAAAMLRVLDSGWYVLGSEVSGFEQEFARHFGFAAAAGVANGTDAIALALRALGIGRGERVATVSHTAVATVAAIEMAGAVPVFVEIDPDTYTMSPESLARVCDRFKPIRAVIPVHLYGQPADMPTILEVARAHGAYVIEDCAQAHGARMADRYAGTMGDLATFSFYPTKNLGAMGDGGMVASCEPERIQRVRALREYGWERRYVSEVAGVNSRLDELQAAILRVRLKYLEDGNLRRRAIAAAYDAGLAGTGLTLPQCRSGITHVFHQYVVQHAERDRLQQRLKERGVGTNVHYPVPVHRQPAYFSRCEADPCGLRITEAFADRILSLPMWPEMNDEDVAAVIAAVGDSL